MTKKQNKKNSQIESTIMNKINSGEIKMRSHWYFGILGLLSVLIVALLGVVAIYASSIITLWLRVIAIDGPAFGAKNRIGELLLSFPWWSILLITISVITLVSIINKFNHLYKIKLIYLLPFALILVIIFGYVTSYTKLPNIINVKGQYDNQCNISDEDCLTRGRIYRKMRQMK